jgi:hypothetical protein
MTDAVEEIAERTKAEMAERLDDLAWRMIDTMPEKIEGAPLHHVASALATCVDKARLLRNQPTDITDDYSNLTDEQRAARLAEIYDAARARRARRTPRRAETPDTPD